MKHLHKLLSVAIWTVILFLAGCNNDEIESQLGPTTDVVFDSVTANGSDQERTSSLTLSFDQDIEGLSLSDIYLTSGETGAIANGLTAKGNGVYEVAVRRVYAIGELAVSVAKEGFFFNPPLQWVTVYGSTIPVDWKELSGNGSSTQASTKLTLTFEGDIAEELSVDDIIFEQTEFPGTGEDPKPILKTIADKGALTYLGDGVFDLELLDVTDEGDLTINIEKHGYEITPATQTIHLYPWTQIKWTTLEADGSKGTEEGEEPALTTKLTFTFDADINGLTTDDITIDAGETGAVKGKLEHKETGIYELPITGIVQSGSLSVSIFKSGYIIDPTKKDVSIYYVKPEEEVVE